MTVRNVDELLKKYGGDPGRYQVFVFCLLCFCMCSLAVNNMINLFIITTYPHHCKISDNWSTNESIPILDNGEYDSCIVYINASNHSLGTTECTSGWEFYPPDEEWTIVQEWDLVCAKHYRGALATTLYFAGVTVGAALFGYLADRVGRKPVMVGSLLVNSILILIIPFSTNYLMYVSLRFFHGLFLQGAFNCAYILAVEMFLPHRRTTVAVIAQAIWPTILCTLAVLFYFFKSWKTVHLITNVPFILTVSYIWLMPESIRWLLAVGRVSKAKEELTRICRINKLPLSSGFTDDIQSVADEINKKRKQTINKKYGFLDLFRRKKMRIISLMSFYYYFSAIFAFYGISFAMAGFKVNLYLSFALSSLVELMAVFSMYFVLQRVGRKTTSFCTLSICSAVCFTVVILQLTASGEASEMGVTIVAAFGRAALAGFFSSMPIFSNELSPTVLRNLLCGIANFWGRIGAMVAPQVMLLELYVWKPLPFLICAILCSSAALFTSFLPETKDKPLPDVPEEVDTLWSGQKSILSINGDKHKDFENVPLTNSET